MNTVLLFVFLKAHYEVFMVVYVLSESGRLWEEVFNEQRLKRKLKWVIQQTETSCRSHRRSSSSCYFPGEVKQKLNIYETIWRDLSVISHFCISAFPETLAERFFSLMLHSQTRSCAVWLSSPRVSETCRRHTLSFLKHRQRGRSGNMSSAQASGHPSCLCVLYVGN